MKMRKIKNPIWGAKTTPKWVMPNMTYGTYKKWSLMQQADMTFDGGPRD
jgi:hypothetical protein